MQKPQLPPLLPDIKLSMSREQDEFSHLANADYQALRSAVLSRDEYTCQYCGFATNPDRTAKQGSLLLSGYLEVHHIDNDHNNNQENNLITVCPFCHSVFHIGFASSHNRISLIYCPDISQAELNLLCNMLGSISLRTNNEYKIAATSFYQELLQMSKPLDDYFGVDFSSGKALSSFLSKLTDEKKKEAFFKNIRVLPRLDSFNESLSYFALHSWFNGDNWTKAWEVIANV